jgi:hypothetical protein
MQSTVLPPEVNPGRMRVTPLGAFEALASISFGPIHGWRWTCFLDRDRISFELIGTIQNRENDYGLQTL